MAEELFIGGPLAGWRETSGYGDRMLYPKFDALKTYSISEPDLLADAMDSVGSYARRRFWHPAWRVTLAFWTCDEELTRHNPVIPAGTVLPGLIQGIPLPRCALADRRAS